MPRNAKVDAETRTRAVVLVEEGYSYRDVGTRLGISHKTVFRLVKKHRETGSIVDKPGSGRPTVTTEREDRILVRKSLGDRRLTSSELRAKMEDDHGVQYMFRAELCVADSSRHDCVDVLRQRNPCCGIRLSASGWRSLANIETGRSNSGTVYCGRTKAPFSFSVGQSGRMYAGEWVRSTAHSALSPQ